MSGWYTPTILMIAAIVWGFTTIENAIAILVVSCPCALILATPTAMVAALSCAARLGILIKNVKDLEVAGKLTAMVLDKTGTLTTGKLAVTKPGAVGGHRWGGVSSMGGRVGRTVQQSPRRPAPWSRWPGRHGWC